MFEGMHQFHTIIKFLLATKKIYTIVREAYTFQKFIYKKLWQSYLFVVTEIASTIKENIFKKFRKMSQLSQVQ